MAKARSNEKLYSTTEDRSDRRRTLPSKAYRAAAATGRGRRLARWPSSRRPTRVALDQIIECYHNRRAAQREIRTLRSNLGLKVHVSAYGMYGFALLERQPDFRKIMERPR